MSLRLLQVTFPPIDPWRLELGTFKLPRVARVILSILVPRTDRLTTSESDCILIQAPDYSRKCSVENAMCAIFELNILILLWNELELNNLSSPRKNLSCTSDFWSETCKHLNILSYIYIYMLTVKSKVFHRTNYVTVRRTFSKLSQLRFFQSMMLKEALVWYWSVTASDSSRPRLCLPHSRSYGTCVFLYSLVSITPCRKHHFVGAWNENTFPPSDRFYLICTSVTISGCLWEVLDNQFSFDGIVR